MSYKDDAEIEQQLEHFGANMRAARLRAGMTQTELSRMDGLDRAALSLTEKGKRSPDMRTLLRICQGIGVKPTELVQDIGFPAAGVAASRKRGSPKGRFGHNLRAARHHAGVSQQGLGKQSSVDPAAISLYERGEREPNLRTLLKLARTLRVSPADLLEGLG